MQTLLNYCFFFPGYISIFCKIIFHKCIIKIFSIKKKLKKMDPIHLVASELEYELGIRGVSSQGTARQKTNSLRLLLLREAAGENLIERSFINQLSVPNELSACGKILEDVIQTMQQANFISTDRMDCRSRLMHLLDRVKRIKPVTSENQVEANQIIEAAEAKLLLYTQSSNSDQVSQHRQSMSTAQSASPLAAAIEIIQTSRQNKIPSSNSINKPVQINQPVSFSKARRTLLNPAAPNFDPIASEGAVGGLSELHIPDNYNHPSPEYRQAQSHFPQPNYQRGDIQAPVHAAGQNLFRQTCNIPRSNNYMHQANIMRSPSPLSVSDNSWIVIIVNLKGCNIESRFQYTNGNSFIVVMVRVSTFMIFCPRYKCLKCQREFRMRNYCHLLCIYSPEGRGFGIVRGMIHLKVGAKW